MPPDRWSRPTACAGWDALDALVHLNIGLSFYPTLIGNGLAGRDQPPWEFPPGVKPSEEFRRLHRELHSEDPAIVLDGVRANFDTDQSAPDAVDDAALDRAIWFYGLPASLRFAIETRLFDFVLHGADIFRAVGTEPWFTSEGGAFAGEYATQVINRFFDPAKLAGLAGAVRQSIDGQTSRAEIEEGAIQIGETDGSEPASLATTGGVWALLTWGRLTFSEAVDRGLIQWGGDRALIERYLGALRTP